MLRYSRLFIGVMLLLLSSCATKKQQTFNFGGGRDYAVNEVIISTPEDKSETLENIEPAYLTETVISAKKKTIPNNGLAHRIAQKKVSKLVEKQLQETEIAKVKSENLSKKKTTNNKTINVIMIVLLTLLIIVGIVIILLILEFIGFLAFFF